MSEGFVVIAVILISCGFFMAGQLWEGRKTAFWRNEWIINEHKLARLEDREPEEIGE